VGLEGPEPDLRARMRLGLSSALRRAAGAQRLSGVPLVALMGAAVLAPVVVAADGTAGPVLLAGMGVASSFGVNVLTDVITRVADRLRADGKKLSQASVEAGLAAGLAQALEGGGEPASAMREAIAAVLRRVGAVGALVEEAVARDRELLPAVVEGFAGLAEQFSEFAFAADDVRHAAWEIEEALRQQQAGLRAEQERARENALALQRVLEAVERGRGSAGGARDAGSGRDSAWPGCPYAGLAPFEERDARVFYGRRELTDRLVQRAGERLGGGGMLLVVGASGAGKSSLLRAGVMPRLAAGALGPGSEKWPRRVMRPTESPLRELAAHLADLAFADPVSVYQSLLAAPQEAPLLVRQALMPAADPGATAGWPAAGDAGARLILVVDQFEELFTASEEAAEGPAERQAFVTALHAAATVQPGSRRAPAALVVVVLRGDYLDRAISYPALAAALDAGPFAVGPMSEAEVRLAITGPAAEAGLSVQPALIRVVISELRSEGSQGAVGSGVLPLMSQAMAATWEGREEGELTVRGYQRAGGVADAVNRGARSAYEKLTSSQRAAARVVFTRLTVITPDGHLARRRCSRAELMPPDAAETDDIAAVITVFAASRLLVLADEGIEISHDVLLQSWQQLRDWLGDDQAGRALYGQVIADAQAWDTSRRDPSYLYRPGRLAAVEAATAHWAAAPARYPPLTPAGTAFLRAARRAAHSAVRRQRAVIAGLVVLTLTAVAAAGIAAHDAAIAARQHAIALSRQLAAASLALEPTDLLNARRLAVAAWRVYPTDQAGTAMTSMLAQQKQNGILPADPAAVNGIAFSPDGKILASADGGGTVRLWNPATGQGIRKAIRADTAKGDRGGVSAVAFSPDGKILASADGDGTVRLWNPATGQGIGAAIRADTTTGPRGGVSKVAFSPDGKILATADGDGTVRLWNPATGRPLTPPIHVGSSAAAGVSGIAFSPDGSALAISSYDRDGQGGAVRLWDPGTGQPLGAPILAASSATFGVAAMAFSPDGQTLVTASNDNLPGGGGAVRLWDPGTGRSLGPFIHVATGVSAVAFSPDGKSLATASYNADGTVRLWNPVTGRSLGAPVHATSSVAGGVSAIAFSPDGTILATAGVEDDGGGTVRLWNPATDQPHGAPLKVSPAQQADASAVAFSPDGKILASADGDGQVQLWDPVNGQALRTPVYAATPSAGGDISGVAFSPDGKILVTAIAGTVQAWDPATSRPLGPPVRATRTAMGSVSDIAFRPRGLALATASDDGTVRLRDPVTGHPLGPPIHAASSATGGVFGIAFSPDGKILATGGEGLARLWDPVTGSPLGAPIRPAGTRSAVLAVAFSPDGKILATAGSDGTMQLWDPVTRRALSPLIQVSANRAAVYALAFSPDGKILATGGSDGIMQLRDPVTGHPLGAPIHAASSATGGVFGIAFSPDGKTIATVSSDGTVRLWATTLFADPYAALCADVGPPTRQVWARYAPGEPQPGICA
jgi:WD40 repeat protein